jgi:squalene-hopene/tetraprenyl-beta-curcumene cyclase
MVSVRWRRALAAARERLLGELTPDGHWIGRLSSSALSTATAIVALASHGRAVGPTAGDRDLARAGVRWLLENQNADGGWGDTADSPSNISTTALAWAAFAYAQELGVPAKAGGQRAERWIAGRAGGADAASLARAIGDRYGRDRTFSAPILTTCALSGRFGSGPDAWRTVPQLPFELAACPRAWFRALRLPVVSYALPALVAIGLVRHRRRRSWNPLAALGRDAVAPRTLRLLAALQPRGGGFLEATPLTSFVIMSLVSAGEIAHPVVGPGLEFIRRSARADGSWPIDTNLATWVTTLAMDALAAGGDPLPAELRVSLRQWLLDQQWRDRHSYTDAAPGGWAWTDLAGGVPDADDTCGALLALRAIGPGDPTVRAAATSGVRWLLDVQNRDGGVPTFCRGWGALPFDRSGADLTAHALAAWASWAPDLDAALAARVPAAIGRALRYLRGVQRADGAFVPLWFGNQHAPTEENATYGTSRVVSALARLPPEYADQTASMIDGAVRWLVGAQHARGAWGGAAGAPPSIEETALAVHALAGVAKGTRRHLVPAVIHGAEWLVEATDGGTRFPAAPIGLYFAKLWYYERLYPIVFVVSALEGATAAFPEAGGRVSEAGSPSASGPRPPAPGPLPP